MSTKPEVRDRRIRIIGIIGYVIISLVSIALLQISPLWAILTECLMVPWGRSRPYPS